MKAIKNNIFLLTSITAISLFSAIPAVAQSKFSPVYVKDGSGKIVRTGSGSCMHTSEWQQGMFECPPVILPVVIEFIDAHPKVVKVIVEGTEFFDFDKAELKDGAKTKLIKLADMIKKPEKVAHIKVYGYTDRIGSDEYNLTLAKKRADSVRDFLVGQNQISSDMVEVIAAGKKNPRVTCENVHGKKQLINCLGANRRVEILLTYDLTVVK